MKPLIASSGLGSRVRVIAQALALGYDRVTWAINQHCPVEHRVIFPSGIDGLEIIDVKSSIHVDYTWREFPDGGGACVRSIFAAMQLPDFAPMQLGIHYRGWRFPRAGNFDAFVPAVMDAIARYPDTIDIAMLADSHRDDLREVLGSRIIPCASKPLGYDLDRSPSDIRAFMLDWRRLLACSEIVSNFPRSCILWPHKFLLGELS